jgi:rhamnosyltransferase
MLKSVFSIIVTYKPNIEDLNRTIAQLSKSNISIIIVDNTDSSDEIIVTHDAVTILNMGYNAGIAKAQNRGIQLVRDCGADFVCFFDQDSIIPENYLDLLNDVSPFDIEVNCPFPFDQNTNDDICPFKLSKNGVPVLCIPHDGVKVRVDLAISSGTIASMSTIDLVGGMDDSLFIDLVDNDWCLRCSSFDVPIYVNPNVRLPHSIGYYKDSFGKVVHNPFRMYFQLRNSIYFLTKKHVPLKYALFLTASSIYRLTYFILTKSDRVNYFKSGVRAIRDGIKSLIKKGR